MSERLRSGTFNLCLNIYEIMNKNSICNNNRNNKNLYYLLIYLYFELNQAKHEIAGQILSSFHLLN